MRSSYSTNNGYTYALFKDALYTLFYLKQKRNEHRNRGGNKNKPIRTTNFRIPFPSKLFNSKIQMWANRDYHTL
jgi:hypothetical protein